MHGPLGWTGYVCLRGYTDGIGIVLTSFILELGNLRDRLGYWIGG